MLYHVTATHSVADCPLYNPELRPAVQEASTRADALAQELGLTVHFAVSAAPAHAFYYLLEADDYSAVQQYVAASPIRSEFVITPVVPAQQVPNTLLNSEGSE